MDAKQYQGGRPLVSAPLTLRIIPSELVHWALEGLGMLVFIDESGDPGFKLDGGSSPVFVAAMVIF
jgi:hypothetical protein